MELWYPCKRGCGEGFPFFFRGAGLRLQLQVGPREGPQPLHPALRGAQNTEPRAVTPIRPTLGTALPISQPKGPAFVPGSSLLQGTSLRLRFPNITFLGAESHNSLTLQTGDLGCSSSFAIFCAYPSRSEFSSAPAVLLSIRTIMVNE